MHHRVREFFSAPGVLQRIGSSSAHRAAGIFSSQLGFKPGKCAFDRSEKRRAASLREDCAAARRRWRSFFVADWFLCLPGVCLNVMHGTAARSGAG